MRRGEDRRREEKRGGLCYTSCASPRAFKHRPIYEKNERKFFDSLFCRRDVGRGRKGGRGEGKEAGERGGEAGEGTGERELEAGRGGRGRGKRIDMIPREFTLLI